MKKSVRIEFNDDKDIAEFECSRYEFDPIGAKGFLYLEDEDGKTYAYVQLANIGVMVIEEGGADGSEA